MLSRFATIGCDVDPMLHQQCVLRVLNRNLSSITHHDGEWNERSRRQHLSQFFLHLLTFNLQYVVLSQFNYLGKREQTV